MSVLVNKDSKVIFQGITGSFGSRHARACDENLDTQLLCRRSPP